VGPETRKLLPQGDAPARIGGQWHGSVAWWLLKVLVGQRFIQPKTCGVSHMSQILKFSVNQQRIIVLFILAFAAMC
jgi:hypothetical protein